MHLIFVRFDNFWKPIATQLEQIRSYIILPYEVFPLTMKLPMFLVRNKQNPKLRAHMANGRKWM